jgi:hypothetical protein
VRPNPTAESALLPVFESILFPLLDVGGVPIPDGSDRQSVRLRIDGNKRGEVRIVLAYSNLESQRLQLASADNRAEKPGKHLAGDRSRSRATLGDVIAVIIHRCLPRRNVR